MATINIIYGSTTGATQSAAEAIARQLGGKIINAASATPADFEADLLILGSSTWGIGELQDDWFSAIHQLDQLDLTGRKAAVFGLGDQNGFSGTYVDAIGILADRLRKRGAELIGRTSSDGYTHSASLAESGGSFAGLALDDDNEPEKTPERIAAWVKQLQEESR